MIMLLFTILVIIYKYALFISTKYRSMLLIYNVQEEMFCEIREEGNRHTKTKNEEEPVWTNDFIIGHVQILMSKISTIVNICWKKN